MQSLLTVHIVAGGLAVVTGGLALLVAKGSWLHRKGGLLFVYSMIVMGTSASILSLKHGINTNLMAGLTSAYFVVTALTTVRPVTSWSTRLTAAAMSVAIGLGLLEAWIALRTMAGGRFIVNGAPVPMLLFLAVVTLLAAYGDVRVLRRGPLRGAPRLKRHLWRMCYALFISAGSFFSIRSRVARVLPLPDPLLNMPWRMVPVLLVFVAMFYWLWRLRARRAGLPTTA